MEGEIYGTCRTYGETRGKATSFGEPQRKRLLQNPSSISRDNIKMPLTEAGLKGSISLNWLRIEPNDKLL
jgi:hypothetical protein